jgi:hypothetical protein
MERSPAVRNISIDNLGGGIDLRPGIVTDKANIFRELRNYWTTPGETLRRRPPFALVPGPLDPRCQGARTFNGVLHVVAPTGVTMAHTLGMPVTTVAFDPPDNAAGPWELIEFNAFNGQLIAVIAHTFDSPAAVSYTHLRAHET